jgi:hypothetical protein
MMRHFRIALSFSHVLALCVACLPTRSAASQSTSPIFRHINIQPFGRIELGEILSMRTELFVPAGPGYVRLQPAGGQKWSFADTRAILVGLTKQRTVCAIVFQYLPLKSYTQAVEEYRQDFGVAPELRRMQQGKSVRSVRWQDARTAFTFEETVVANEVQLVSRMEDRRFVAGKSCGVE